MKQSKLWRKLQMKPRGTKLQSAAESRFCLYTVGCFFLIAAVVCIAVGGLVSRAVELALIAKYRSLIISDNQNDTSPDVSFPQTGGGSGVAHHARPLSVVVVDARGARGVTLTPSHSREPVCCCCCCGAGVPCCVGS